MDTKKAMLRRIALLLPVLLAVSIALPAPARAMDEGFSNTLREIELAVVQVENHSAELRAMLRFPSASWKSHSFEWNRIRERANDLGEQVKQLQKHKLNSRMSNWERDSVVRIVARINALAAAAEEGIRFLNQNRNMTVLATSDEYSNNITRIRDLADQVEGLVDYFKDRSEYEEELQS